MDILPIRRALLSVTHKEGLTELGTFLHQRGVELVSTGGTLKVLATAGLPVKSVSDVTGFPEILGGRVKTLHPHIHGGVLADKDNPDHLATLEEKGIKPFDLVCVNLYNFESAVSRSLDPREAIEEIDIGGPCLLRAAAKNYHSVLVLPSPDVYAEAIAALEKGGMGISLAFRQRMAVRVFRTVSQYDAMIAAYLERRGA